MHSRALIEAYGGFARQARKEPRFLRPFRSKGGQDGGRNLLRPGGIRVLITSLRKLVGPGVPVQ